MSAERTCPTCSTENAQRIGDILRDSQSRKGEPSAVPASYHPPKAPWAYLQGFLLGIPVNAAVMLTMGSPQSSESEMAMAEMASSAAFLGVWVGYGILKNKNYTQKLDAWKETSASKFFCRKCSHAFDG
ncbi:hypothetical protein YTPLAS72_06180 [Nitrospira sp.]|nr:hypothetical protein YTPLAS72_06180 [Nitrospira sp.]